MSNLWRLRFIDLEQAKQNDLHPHAYFNTKLDFVKSAIGFDPEQDNYYALHAIDYSQDGTQDFCTSYRHDAYMRASYHKLPERLFIRCGAITKNYGYPEDAKYNWRVFDCYGSSKYLCASECNLFGFDYYDGTAPKGIMFEKNLQSDLYKHAIKNHEMTCKAIDAMKKHIDQELYAKYEAKWKSRWWSLYNEYLLSDVWQDKREQRLYIDCGMCTKCGKNSEQATLQAHHLTYKNVGDEDVYQDLVILCSHCHTIEHGKEKKS